MKYVGLDVHVKATVWCCLDEEGKVVARGKVSTTTDGIQALVAQLGSPEDLLLGQEAGGMSHFVHDIITGTGARLLTFNAYHLRMIAASRKKTDRRDAYWIARALQTGMMPHPVYIPTGEVRELRGLMAQRATVVEDRKSWLIRAKMLLHSAGVMHARTPGSHRWLELALQSADGLDEVTAQRIEQCQRMYEVLTDELKGVERKIHEHAKMNDDVRRLMTIPAVGEKVAVTLVAWIGDITRFRNAKVLSSYAGLAPSVRQSAERTISGGISKEGSPQLRTMLVQAGHVLLWKCDNEHGGPLRAAAARVHSSRGRRKIAVVAAARHILKVAFYILRDGTEYDPKLLRPPPSADAA